MFFQELIDRFVQSWQTPLGIASQIISLLALFMSTWSFQEKNINRLLIFQTIGLALFIVSMLMLDPPGLVMAITNFVTIVRNIFSFIFKNKKKTFLFAFVPFYIAIYVLTFTVLKPFAFPNQEPNVFDYIVNTFPTIAILILTFCLASGREKQIVIFSLIAEPFFFTYDLYYVCLGAVISDIICTTSMIVALIRFRKRKSN